MFLLLSVTAACGDDPPGGGSETTASNDDATLPAISTTATIDTTVAATAGSAAILIREMTDAEWEQYNEIDGPIVCPRPNMQAGGYNWDYDVDTSQDPTGRQPEDAFRDAVTEMNQNYIAEVNALGLDVPAEGFLPVEGWVGLTSRDDNSVYFVYPEGAWEDIVLVSGDPETGVWRHHKAWTCVPLPETDR